ncbi:MAG: glucose-6-phosphate isomerase [Lentisphaerae bacterium]|nr:glucose-6-phosphate isomerase [Lentisphaerota bacterium]
MTNTESFAIPFDSRTGLTTDRKPIQRRLSQMQGMYANGTAYAGLLAQGDALVYEFYDLHLPESEAAIAFGTTITYPGKVGDEYFMTKGHFHRVLATAEVYHCLRGHGYMLMESPEGVCEAQVMRAGVAVYVPPRFAHRSINVSATEPLVSFFAFRGDAGHDYGTIEAKGFRKLVVDRGGLPAIVDNPKWGM